MDLTVRSDLPISLATNFWGADGVCCITRNTAISSKVQFLHFAGRPRAKFALMNVGVALCSSVEGFQSKWSSRLRSGVVQVLRHPDQISNPDSLVDLPVAVVLQFFGRWFRSCGFRSGKRNACREAKQEKDRVLHVVKDKFISFTQASASEIFFISPSSCSSKLRLIITPISFPGFTPISMSIFPVK